MKHTIAAPPRDELRKLIARPTILIVEPEPREALSTRKLVVETGKFNVLTAHSGKEGIELLRRFPNLDAMVLVAQLKNCEGTVKSAKSIKPSLPVILLSANRSYRCHNAEHHLSSHEPGELVNLLRSLFGDPRNNS